MALSNSLVKLLFTYLCFSFFAEMTESAVLTEKTVLNDSTTIAPKSVKEIEKEIEGLVTYVTKLGLPYFVRNSDLKLSSSCMSTLIKMFVDVRKLKLPVIKLIDAIGKPRYGLLKGGFALMGDYDECLEVSATKKGEIPKSKKEEYYHGQYCTIQIDMPPKLVEAISDYASGNINLTYFGKLGNIVGEFPASNFAGGYFIFNYGICVPSTCTPDDISEMLGLIPASFVETKVKHCVDGAAKTITVDQVICLVIFGLIAFLVLVGTIVDACLYLHSSTYDGNHNDKCAQFFLAFSIYSNTKKFFNTKKISSGEIPSINGMYVLGTFLVVIYHTYFLPFFALFSSNSANIGHYLGDFDFTLLVTMAISIEAYFLFSGFFLTYARFRRGTKNVQVNVIKIIVRRYIRLCPSMLVILGIILLLPLIGSGPVWTDIFDVAADNTRKWWYTYVLMYNNFLEVKDLNFLYLWFIPCLMQISIVGAFLVWIIAKSPKLGIFLTIAVGLACNITLGIWTYLRSYPPAYAIYYYNKREHFEEPIYTAPLSHVCSYGIGMLLGYYMAQKPAFKWTKVRVIGGWILALFCTVGMQYIMYLGHEGGEANPILAALYGATHRTIFSLGVAWIIFACTNGYGGVIGRIYNWKGFAVLSKLGYFGYLIHYIIIAFHVSMTRNALMYSHYEVWMRIFSYTSLTFFGAYILYITFELPLTYIESLFLPQRHEEVKANGISKDFPETNNNIIAQTQALPSAVWNGVFTIQKENIVEHSRL